MVHNLLGPLLNQLFAQHGHRVAQQVVQIKTQHLAKATANAWLNSGHAQKHTASFFAKLMSGGGFRIK